MYPLKPMPNVKRSLSPMRSKMLAQHDLLCGGKRAEVTLVDFLGLDMERQVPGQVFLDRRRIVAEIATVGLAVDHGVGVGYVGLVDGIKLVVAAAAVLRHPAPGLGNGRESFLLRVVLHMRQQGP